MNDVTTLATSKPPAMSTDLQAAIICWTLQRDGLLGQLDEYARSTVSREAAAILPRFEAWCQPNSTEVMRWLAMLRLAVINPPSQEELDLRLPIFVLGLGDLPAPVFSSDSLGRAVRAFKFWPAVAEIAELLAPEVRRITQDRRALTYIAGLSLLKPNPRLQLPAI